jgi:hypothetical protein
MSSIPPIEPMRPSLRARKVEREAEEQGRRERQAEEHRQEPDEDVEDDGLPHVDVRV